MRKTTWLAIGLIFVIGLSGCGGRRLATTEQPKSSSEQTTAEAAKIPAEPSTTQKTNLDNQQDIDELMHTLDELADLVGSLDPVDESSLIIPEE